MALQQAEGGIAQSIVRKDARNCLEREGIYLMELWIFQPWHFVFQFVFLKLILQQVAQMFFFHMMIRLLCVNL